MIPTSQYIYFQCPFETFNPVQEACYNFFTEDCNLVVASSLSSGKTAIGECIFGYELFNGGRVCYLSPLKALSREKFDIWQTHKTFSKYGVSFVTGEDFVNEEDLQNNNVILTTVESFDVRVRKKSEWMKSLRCLVVDEAHLLGHKKRGSDLEGLLMRITSINNQCRIIFLSGTLANAEEVAKWLKKLNGKTTRFVKSEWQPVTVNKKIVVSHGYDDQIEIVKEYADDNIFGKTLVFVHSKKFGLRMMQELCRSGISCDFYYSDLTKSKRAKIAQNFRDGNLDVLISTSALGMGINL